MEPSRAEIDALRARALGVDDHFDIFAALPPVPAPPRRVRHLLVAAALVVGVVVAGGLVVWSAETPGPSGRSATVGAPGRAAETRALAEARLALSKLRAALASPDDTRVALAREALQMALGRLDPGERSTIASDAQRLLDLADARLRQVPTENGTAPSPTVAESVPAPDGAQPPSGSDQPSLTSAPGSSVEPGSGAEADDTPGQPEATEPTEPTEPPESPDS